MHANSRGIIWTFCFVLVSLIICSEARAGNTTRTGTGRLKIASGIVLTSVLTTAGALAIMSYGMGLCGEDTYDSCSSDYVLGGAAAMGVGLGLGIPLIVSGARDRKANKANNRAEDVSPTGGNSPFGLNFYITKKKGSLLNLTYDL